MPANFAVIYVRQFTFNVRPALPEVYVGFEPFVVGIDWSDNKDQWDWVRVQNFTRPNGAPVTTVQPPSWTFHRNQTPTVQQFAFSSLPDPADGFYEYELVYHRANGEEFVVDPTLMIRRV